MQELTSAAKVARLVDFRQFIYDRCFVRARDALFEMLDAVLISRSITSFAELSLAPVFRRQWPSLYEALDDAVVDQAALLPLLLGEVLRERPESQQRLVFALDHSAWPRAQAYTLAERRFCHKADPVPGNRPITIGYDYSTLAWVAHSEPQAEPDSWCLPLLHEAIGPSSAPLTMAAEQLHRLVTALGPDAERVVVLGDSEYGSAPFVAATAGLRCGKLLRLRPNRVLYQAPPPYSGCGRRRKHGAKFKLKDPSTWGEAAEEHLLEDARFGRLRLRRYSQLHFVTTPELPMEIILVEQLHADGTLKRAMWLIWLGPEMPSLEELWRWYLRRFAIDHWYRFAKQRLHWTRPKLSTPERSQHWSALMPLAQWQLYLARELVAEARLPWQKPQQHPTPGRVAEGFSGVLLTIGTPAHAPKPRGNSPGWPRGQPRQRRQQHKLERKTTRRYSSTPKVLS